jgi:hypothetical protein
MNRIALIAVIVVAATAGCAGKTEMLRLKSDVLNLVPEGDRARLNPYVEAIAKAKQDVASAKEALEKAQAEVKKGRTEKQRAALLADAKAAKVSWLDARKARLEAEHKAQKEAVDTADAEHEYQRAVLAAEKGLIPYENFSPKKYEAQFRGYQKALAEAKQAVDKATQAEKDAESAYKKAQEKLDKFTD